MIAYAHQGGAKEAPSSTLYAIRRALEHGATGIELDVHATSDGQLVVCHDPTLDRTTDATGEIADASPRRAARARQRLLVPARRGRRHGAPAEDYVLRGRAPADRDLGVATLSEVLEAFPGVVLNLDIKRTAPGRRRLRGGARPRARRARPRRRRDRGLVPRRGHRRLHAGTRPAIGISAGTEATTEFYRRLQAGAAAPGRHQALRRAPGPGALRPARRSWTSDSSRRRTRAGSRSTSGRSMIPRRWSTWSALGVDGIISDKPTRARRRA